MLNAHLHRSPMGSPAILGGASRVQPVGIITTTTMTGTRLRGLS